MQTGAGVVGFRDAPPKTVACPGQARFSFGKSSLGVANATQEVVEK